MLHIVTPLYRFENLESIYNSIYNNDDIVWHISKSNKRENINFNFIKNDKRIKIYNVNCNDNEVGKKRSFALQKINNGYFCLLDDDTIFHENMYLKYREYQEKNFIGMLVGEQLNPINEIRLTASIPLYTRIDTGNVLSHTSCLGECKWPEKPFSGNDYIFWDSVYNFYGKKCTLWNQPISYYNKLSKDDRWKKEKKVLRVVRPK